MKANGASAQTQTEMGFVGGEIWAAGLGSIPLHHGVQCTEQTLKITTEKKAAWNNFMY